VTRVELQRSRQPVAQPGRQRLLAALRGDGFGRCHQIRALRDEFVLVQHPSENERQRHDADLRDVRSVIEARQPRRRRQCDPQFAPVAFARKAQLLERGAEHVLDHHDACVRRDDEPLRTDGAVRDVARAFVQHRHRRHELADEMQRDGDVDGDWPRPRL
jgi:hypothetical protein